MKLIFKLSFTLFIFCFIAAFSLGAVNKITRPHIELQRRKAIKEALTTVLPDAKIITQKETAAGSLFYCGFTTEDSTGTPAGYAFIAYGQGYSSKIQTMVGVTNDGVIDAIKILFQQETPGLGAKSDEKRPGENVPWFQKQFSGKRAADIKVDKDDGEIVSITGATITSRAIAKSIQKGFKELSENIN